MEKEKNYFVREDLVSNQHTNHDEVIEVNIKSEKDDIIFTGAILEKPKDDRKLFNPCETSEYFLG